MGLDGADTGRRVRWRDRGPRAAAGGPEARAGRCLPVMVAADWSDAQRRAYVLADNKLAMNAGWDDALLRVEIGDLRDLDFNLDLIGFGPDEIAALTFDKNAGLTDPDEAPDAPAIPVSEPGDVWLLGKHRLVCGDCTDRQVVDKALAGVKPHLMVTDPPYGVEYDADWRNEAKRAGGKKFGAFAVGKVENDNQSDWREAWALFSGDVAYVWHASLQTPLAAESLIASGFVLRAQII
jgi:hypothetical protein